MAALGLAGAAPARADHWVASWGQPSSGAWPVSYSLIAARTTGDPEHTFRLLARTTLGGSAVRIRLSNALSSSALTVGAASAGLSGGGAAVRPGSARPVTFGGAPTAVVPAGGTLVSDPVPLAVAAGDDVTVSLYLPSAPTPSLHSLGLRTNYATPAGAGDATADDAGAAFTETNTSMPVLDGLDVLAPDDAGAVVVLGDSLSDGQGTTLDAFDRWPDVLARRLQAAGAPRAVVDAGIAGGSAGCPVGLPMDGPNGLARLDRDVLTRAGLSTVFLFIGTNDLANACTVAQTEAALSTLAERSRDTGARVVGATLIPRIDAHYTDQAKADRLVVNEWIRTSGVYDAVVDFDAAVRAADGGWDPRYDSGDQVHLNAAGYRRLADAVDLTLLGPPANAAPALPPPPAAGSAACAARTLHLRVPPDLHRLRVQVAGHRVRPSRHTRGRLTVRVTRRTTRSVTVTVRARRKDGRPYRRKVRIGRCAA